MLVSVVALSLAYIQHAFNVEAYALTIVVLALVSVLRIHDVEAAKLTNKITKGPKAELNEHPFSIWISFNGTVKCGAVLVDKAWLLTLYSCFGDGPLSMYTAVVGDRLMRSADGEVIVNITKLVPYPNNTNEITGVVLARLETTVDTSLPNVDTIAISNIIPANDSLCSMSAYGDRGVDGKQASYKQKMDIVFVAVGQCNASASYTYVDNSSACYMHTAKQQSKQRKACIGDQGSPLVCEIDGEPSLVALNTESSCVNLENAARLLGDVKDWITRITTDCGETLPRTEIGEYALNMIGGSYYKDTATISCAWSFEPRDISKATITCEENGSWSETTTCVVRTQNTGFTVNGPRDTDTFGRITFVNTVTNNGGGYNKNTGYFTCTVAGSYVFSLTITKLPGADAAGCYIYKGAQVLGIAYANPSNQPALIPASVTVYVNLVPGDRVFPNFCTSAYTTMQHSIQTSFTGYLVGP